MRSDVLKYRLTVVQYSGCQSKYRMCGFEVSNVYLRGTRCLNYLTELQSKLIVKSVLSSFTEH